MVLKQEGLYVFSVGTIPEETEKDHNNQVSESHSQEEEEKVVPAPSTPPAQEITCKHNAVHRCHSDSCTTRNQVLPPSEIERHHKKDRSNSCSPRDTCSNSTADMSEKDKDNQEKSNSQNNQEIEADDRLKDTRSEDIKSNKTTAIGNQHSMDDGSDRISGSQSTPPKGRNKVFKLDMLRNSYEMDQMLRDFSPQRNKIQEPQRTPRIQKPLTLIIQTEKEPSFQEPEIPLSPTQENDVNKDDKLSSKPSAVNGSRRRSSTQRKSGIRRQSGRRRSSQYSGRNPHQSTTESLGSGDYYSDDFDESSDADSISDDGKSDLGLEV